MAADNAAFYADIRAADGSYKFLCNGEWRVSASGTTCDNVNPAKANAPCFTFQACTQGEVDEAYATAKVAHKQWARTPLHKRAEILHRAAELMRQHQGPITDALVKEIAKAAKDAKTVGSMGRWTRPRKREKGSGTVTGCKLKIVVRRFGRLF